jgi:putative ABC transport system ATP-binding protein
MHTAMPALFECRNLGRSYHQGGDQPPALQGLNLRIERGEMLAITGSSGSGKSTLLNLLGLLDEPTSGELLLEGSPVAGVNAVERARLRNRRIGFVFQQFQLLPRLSAWRNVALPLVYAGVAAPERQARARALLEQVGLAAHADKRPLQLSGGQQQRVAIARALACRPAVLLADEPTGALDSATGREVMALLRQLRADTGCTLVIVTHDPAIAAQCPRVLRFQDGHLASDVTHVEVPA